MTALELRIRFPLAFVMTYDTTYARPTKEWIFKKFYPWFKTTRWSGNLDRWTRKNDCDNFAAAFHMYAQDAHAASPDSVTDEGLAVGIFCYHSPRGPHAINVAFVEDSEVIFIEPQTGEQLVLTEQEISTCFFACF